MLHRVFAAQPNLTGYPPFLNSSSFVNQNAHPYQSKGKWEALIYNPEHHFYEYALDFWQISPDGHFYHAKVYEDDTRQVAGGSPRVDKNSKPLDFVLVVSRATEIIGVALAIGKALTEERADSQIRFAFRWTGLAGRRICSWVEPGRNLIQGSEAIDDDATSEIVLPVDIPDQRLPEIVRSVTEPVFAVFGSQVPDIVMEEIVTRTLGRRA